MAFSLTPWLAIIRDSATKQKITELLQKKQKITKALLENDVTNVGLQGETPLMLACGAGEFELAQILLRFGAKLKIRDALSRTALFHAIVAEASKINPVDRIKIVCLLLQHGARVNLRDCYGNNPLYYAIVLQLSDVIELLLKYGAKPEFYDFNALCCALAIGTHSLATCSRILSKSNMFAIVTAPHHLGISMMFPRQPYLHEFVCNYYPTMIPAVVCTMIVRYVVILSSYNVDLSQYVLLWIFDWLPEFGRVSEKEKVLLIESVLLSVEKVRKNRN